MAEGDHSAGPNTQWPLDRVLTTLKNLGSENNRAGMARFGIETERAFGIPMAQLRPLSRRIGRSESLAEQLWATGFHEARLLAILLIPPPALTDDRCWSWLAEIDSWDLCDQLTNVLARRDGSGALVTPLAADDREFVRRAAFALIAWRAVHAKSAPDTEFLDYLPVIRSAATDKRNFVWKAVHWSLRQIGKRSMALHGPALALAKELEVSSDATARRIGKAAARELISPKVLARLGLDND